MVLTYKSVDIEKILVDIGAVKPNDHRILRHKRTEKESPTTGIRKGTLADNADDDDDWD